MEGPGSRSFERAGIGFFHRRVVGDDMDLAIAGAEKRTENPAHEADDDRAEEGVPESLDMKRWNDLRDQQEEQGIDHKNEKSHRDNNERQAEQEQHRADNGIDDAEKQGSPEKGSHRFAFEPGDKLRGHIDRNRRHEPANEECSHVPILFQWKLF